MEHEHESIANTPYLCLFLATCRCSSALPSLLVLAPQALPCLACPPSAPPWPPSTQLAQAACPPALASQVPTQALVALWVHLALVVHVALQVRKSRVSGACRVLTCI
jgi:hypothetical protein